MTGARRRGRRSFWTSLATVAFLHPRPLTRARSLAIDGPPLPPRSCRIVIYRCEFFAGSRQWSRNREAQVHPPPPPDLQVSQRGAAIDFLFPKRIAVALTGLSHTIFVVDKCVSDGRCPHCKPGRSGMPTARVTKKGVSGRSTRRQVCRRRQRSRATFRQRAGVF